MKAATQKQPKRYRTQPRSTTSPICCRSRAAYPRTRTPVPSHHQGSEYPWTIPRPGAYRSGSAPSSSPWPSSPRWRSCSSGLWRGYGTTSERAWNLPRMSRSSPPTGGTPTSSPRPTACSSTTGGTCRRPCKATAPTSRPTPSPGTNGQHNRHHHRQSQRLQAYILTAGLRCK